LHYQKWALCRFALRRWAATPKRNAHLQEDRANSRWHKHCVHAEGDVHQWRRKRYPAEIEQVLLSHPEVQDAAVIGVPDSKWGEVGAAYLVARKQGEIDPEIILEFVNTRFARYKLPKEICFLDSLPRNASWKINKGRVARQVPLCGCSPILGDTWIRRILCPESSRNADLTRISTVF
jgi:hypothetical protein